MENICEVQATWHEIFGTQNGTLFQSDEQGCFYLDFAGKLDCYDHRALIRLRKAVDSLDIRQLILDSSAPNLEIISLYATDHCYILSLTEVLQLKELLQGAFVMFKLNHIIQDCLYRVVA